MSDTGDQDSKTEEASEKKISDAVKKGNVPFSREAGTFVSLLGMLIVAKFVLWNSSLYLSVFLSRFIENPGGWRLDDTQTLSNMLQAVAIQALLFILPIFTILTGGALISAFLQNPPSLVFHRIKPDFGKLNLKKGFKRVFGAQGWVEFAKALFKFCAISIVVGLLLKAETKEIISAVFTPPSSLPIMLLTLATGLVSTITVATIAMVAADILWSRKQWFTNLRMTKQEVKDELKQLDGDPIIKAKRLSLARDRLRKRMIAAVPQATVIITNPTHFSVALRYDAEKDAAPVVLAKGQDYIALKIREVAEEHNIPRVENRLLARSLYRQVEVDQLIPPEFYSAVAEIIHYVSSNRVRP